MDKAKNEKCETSPIKLWSQKKKELDNVNNLVNKCDLFTKKNQVSNFAKIKPENETLLILGILRKLEKDFLP